MRRLAIVAALAALLVAGARAAPVVDPSAPQPPTTTTAPSTPPSVFAANGLLVARPGDLDPARLAARMRSFRFSWVAVLVHDGQELRNPDVGAWIKTLQEQRITVGAWGVLRLTPEADAALAVELVRSYGLSFYLADAEFEFSLLGDPGRSRRFLDAFRARAPTLPAVLSSFSRIDGAYGFDWRAWRDAGFEYAPQCYLPEGSAFAPELAIAAARSIWPRSMIHPTIGLYDGADASSYGPGLGEGYSVFPGESIDAPEFVVPAGL